MAGENKVGWSATQPSQEPQSFGMQQQVANESIKAKVINLISATRVLMRSKLVLPHPEGRKGELTGHEFGGR